MYVEIAALFMNSVRAIDVTSLKIWMGYSRNDRDF